MRSIITLINEKGNYMHPKIRQIAEQSAFDEIGKDYSLYFNLTKEKVEQFAELIIRECSSLCDDGNGEMSSMAENKWKNHCRDLILKNFNL